MGSKLVQYSVQSVPKMKVIGKSVRTKSQVSLDDSTITDLWESIKKDGSLDLLLSLPDRWTQTPDCVGWMGDFQPGDEDYTYLAGVLFQPEAAVPDGFVARDIFAADLALAWIQETDGDEGGDVIADASSHLSIANKAHGYEYDGANGLFELEYYSHERFLAPRERGEPVILDFYSPCKKIASS